MLQDTINHVLDYSKINSFEKAGNQKGACSHRPGSAQTDEEAPGMMSNELIKTTDLALLCEDLINGMMAASEYHGAGTDDPSSASSREFRTDLTTKNQSGRRKILDIILDIEHRDWFYNVQAGMIAKISRFCNGLLILA